MWEGNAVVKGEFKELKLSDFLGKITFCYHMDHDNCLNSLSGQFKTTFNVQTVV